MIKKSHSKSSQNWLREHFNDPFVKEAQALGYRSRAVFKLKEIQQKDNIIKPGMLVIDLGAAPGGWSQLVVEWLKGRGQLFALDILEMEPIEGVNFIQGDFTEETILQQLLSQLNGVKVQVVLSDMAPNTSGLKAVDQPRAMHLAELALEFAHFNLENKGTFLVKVFQGEGFDEFLASMRHRFNKVIVRKPLASRARSREVYLLGKEFIVKP